MQLKTNSKFLLALMFIPVPLIILMLLPENQFTTGGNLAFGFSTITYGFGLVAGSWVYSGKKNKEVSKGSLFEH